jgi:hypothetical protein
MGASTSNMQCRFCDLLGVVSIEFLHHETVSHATWTLLYIHQKYNLQ